MNFFAFIFLCLLLGTLERGWRVRQKRLAVRDATEMLALQAAREKKAAQEEDLYDEDAELNRRVAALVEQMEK